MEVDDEPEIPVHVPSKIRFKEDVLLTSHAVNCVFVDSSNCQVDIGLLSEYHTYVVKFQLAHSLGNDLEVPPIQTPAAVVTALQKCEGRKGHKVTVEVKCGEKGSFEEQILFENSKNETLTLKLIAKVMASQLGTPALKTGVKILHRNTDGLSDTATEWPGFVDSSIAVFDTDSSI